MNSMPAARARPQRAAVRVSKPLSGRRQRHLDKSHHTFKFGIEGRKYISPQSFTQRSRGDYEYLTLDRFLRDVNPDVLAERSNGNPIYYGDQTALYGLRMTTGAFGKTSR